MTELNRRTFLQAASILAASANGIPAYAQSESAPPHMFRSHVRMQQRFDTMRRSHAFTAQTKSEWEEWRQSAIAALKSLTGYDTMVRCSLNPVITEDRAFPGYRRQRVEIQTEPGIVMPLYVLIPDGTPPFPAVMATHGHGAGGKVAVVGIDDDPKIAAAIERFNKSYGLEFVKAGFITFCPDARGFGERREERAMDNILGSSCEFLNNMAMPLGQTVTGMWAWDLHRLIDYIQTRDDCRSDRIGCAGLSGGGLQTLWATALDERIRCAVISGYMYGYKESLLDRSGNCSCNYVSHLWEHVDMGDIGALIAPRPLVVETGNKDPLNGASGLDNVLPQIAVIKRAYALLGAPENIVHDIFDGPHRWHGAVAVPWMQQRLM